MVNEKSKKILDDNYVNLLKEVVEYIVAHDEQFKAGELLKIIFRAVSGNMIELKLKTRLLSFYEETMLKLKFIGLPLLEDNEVVDLLKNNFCFQFKIEQYDLPRKIAAKLTNTIAIDDRNKLKESLRTAILENGEKITANHEIKLVRDWLRHYVSNVGLENQDKLAKTQYLISLKNDHNLGPEEYGNLMILFNLFDYLSLASDTPEGFEEEAPVMIKGKLYIFRKGILEEIPEKSDIKEAMELARDEFPRETDLSFQSVLSQSTPSPSQQTPPPPSPLTELEQILKNYSESSLEYKAISQEISRFKRSELKKSQKIDAKK